jgi:hypothetical protein
MLGTMGHLQMGFSAAGTDSWVCANSLPDGIDDAKTRLDALLSAEIDFLPDPPLDAIDTIRETPGLKLAEAPQLLGAGEPDRPRV